MPIALPSPINNQQSPIPNQSLITDRRSSMFCYDPAAMTTNLVRVCLCVSGLIGPSVAMAQDVAITNARVIVGSGQVIESGTIVVRGGKIVSVGAGAAPTQGLRVIDAKGMSAMPGFIDGHKHVNNYDAAQMKSVLEAGYTTVLAGGGPAEANIALRNRIDKGEIVGPRVIASGQVNLRQTPAEARAAIRPWQRRGSSIRVKSVSRRSRRRRSQRSKCSRRSWTKRRRSAS